MPIKKILITGTAGFIGYHLVKGLIDQEYEIIGLDNINDYYDVNLKYARLKETGINRKDIEWNKIIKSTKYSNYRFIRLNLEDRGEIMDLFHNEKFSIVVNLAAQAGVRASINNPSASISSNIVGFLNILEACRHSDIEHLVYASSSSVYGNSKKMPLSIWDKVDHPIPVYAATKKSNELIAYTYSHLFGLSTTGLRLFTAYGPWGRPDMSYYLFTKAILEGNPINIYNQGNMLRDFTYIDDIISGITKIIKNKFSNIKVTNSPKQTETDPSLSYKIYNIGNSSPIKLLDFISEIERSLNKRAEKNLLPIQAGDVYATHSDITEVVRDFNYNPTTDIKDGIQKFISWYKRYYPSRNYA